MHQRNSNYVLIEKFKDSLAIHWSSAFSQITSVCCQKRSINFSQKHWYWCLGRWKIWLGKTWWIWLHILFMFFSTIAILQYRKEWLWGKHFMRSCSKKHRYKIKCDRYINSYVYFAVVLTQNLHHRYSILISIDFSLD